MTNEELDKDLENITDIVGDKTIMYASREAGIKSFAETYSFNIESILFNQLTLEQQELWRKEIENAVISGGEMGLELACDKRYDKELSKNLEEEIEKIDDQYPVEIQYIREIAHHFAEWQKQKDKQLIGATQKISFQHGYDDGRFDMREEIMKDAVHAWVNTYESVTNPYDNQVSFITNLSPSKFKNKETVKIIICKNE